MKTRFLLGVICLLILFPWLATGQAQEKFPSRPIELVIPFDPGGSSDISARIYTDELGRVLKTNITPVNRPGGAAMQGAAYVVRSKKDGYTLLAGSGAALVNGPVLKKKECPYDPLRDLAPLGNFVYTSTVFAVRGDSPFKTLEELKEFALKNPGKIKAGIAGVGNDSHCNLLMFESKNNLKITGIPFKGGGESLAALLGGHVDMGSNTLATFAENIKAGKLRGLCIVAKARDPDFPNIPTANELGYKDINFYSWQGVFAPAGLPQNVMDTLVQGFEKVFTHPEIQKMAVKAQFIPAYMAPEEFRRHIELQIQLVSKLAQEITLFK